MALPPLVANGQKIPSGHINLIRDWLGTWSAPVSAGNNDLAGLASVTCVNITVTGTLTIPAQGAATSTIPVNLTVPGAVGSAVAGLSLRTTDGPNVVWHEEVLRRVSAGTGANSIESRMQRTVDSVDGPYVGLGSGGTAPNQFNYVSMGSGSTEHVRFTKGTMRIQPRAVSPPTTLSGSIELPDATGSNLWTIFNDNKQFRITRSGSTRPNQLTMEERGYVSLAAAAGDLTPTRPFTVQHPLGFDWNGWTFNGNSTLALVQNGGDIGAFGLYASHFIGSTRNAWFQCGIPAGPTSTWPLLLNPNGGQVVAYAAPTPDNADLPKNCVTFQLDEALNLVRFRIKYSNGSTIKSGSIALT